MGTLSITVRTKQYMGLLSELGLSRLYGVTVRTKQCMGLLSGLNSVMGLLSGLSSTWGYCQD